MPRPLREQRVPMDPAARALIAEWTRPFNARLGELRGRPCAYWD